MGLGILALLLGSMLLASFLDDGDDTPDDTTRDDPLPELPEDTSTATTIEVTGPDGVETRVVEQSSDDLQNQVVVEIAEDETQIVVNPDGQTNVRVLGTAGTDFIEVGRGDSVSPDYPIYPYTDENHAPDQIRLTISEAAFEDQVADIPGNETSVSLAEIREVGNWSELLAERSQNYGHIRLHDAQDNLFIQIDPEIEGNLHVLEYVWQQDGTQYNAQQTSRFYIITSPEITELDPDMFWVDAGGIGSTVALNSDILDTIGQNVQIIAEVSLGSIQTSYDYALDDYVTTGNLNANPDITTSRPVVSTLRIDNGEF